MFYTIGEMARLLCVAPSTLRYYDKEGLLPFVERSRTGIRMFKDIDYEWLQVITCLKKTGMPLKDIKKYIQSAMQGDETIEERLQLFMKQRDEVERQMEDLQKTLALLNYKCWYYEIAKQAGSTKFPSNMPLEELPEQYREVRKALRAE